MSSTALRKWRQINTEYMYTTHLASRTAELLSPASRADRWRHGSRCRRMRTRAGCRAWRPHLASWSAGRSPSPGSRDLPSQNTTYTYSTLSWPSQDHTTCRQNTTYPYNTLNRKVTCNSYDPLQNSSLLHTTYTIWARRLHIITLLAITNTNVVH